MKGSDIQYEKQDNNILVSPDTHIKSESALIPRRRQLALPLE